MRKMLEKELEAKFKKRIEECGGMVWKFVSPGKNGVPDRIVFTGGGKCVFAEVKKPGEKMRRLQLYRSKQIVKCGCPVWQIDSERKIEMFLAAYFGEGREDIGD
jgi:hypothetical protein